MNEPVEESKALSVVKSIIDQGVKGFATLSGANDLANTYINDKGYKSNDDRVNSLIKWETSKNFTTGFLTGLGGLITLPITIPTSLYASWVLQARMCAAIAKIYGYDIEDERVKTMILVCLLGSSAKEALKDVGIQIGTSVAKNFIKNISARTIREINKKVGFMLLTKAGQKGVVNLTKCIPILGGVVGGAVDGVSCNLIGSAAKELFKK